MSDSIEGVYLRNQAPQMNEGRIRKIIHVDMDAFYASVEQRDDPTLKGKPVAVGHPARRGVVAAAMLRGSSFRSSLGDAVNRRRPEVRRTRVCAPKVRRLSRSVQTGSSDLQAITPHLVEPLSLDEAYLDVTDNLKGIPTAWETAKEIRARIYEETKLYRLQLGFPATSSSPRSHRTLANQMVSSRSCPSKPRPLSTLPVAKFHGVGPKTTNRMHALGIETGADLRRQTLDFLQRNFGKAGSWYYEIARGQDDRSVQAMRTQVIGIRKSF